MTWIELVPFYPIGKSFIGRNDIPPFVKQEHQSTFEHVRSFVPNNVCTDIINIIVTYLEHQDNPMTWTRMLISRDHMNIYNQDSYLYFWTYVINLIYPKYTHVQQLLDYVHRDKLSLHFCTYSATNVIDRTTYPLGVIPGIYCSRLGKVGTFDDIVSKQTILSFRGHITNDPEHTFKSCSFCGHVAIVSDSEHIRWWKSRLECKKYNVIEACDIVSWITIVNTIILFEVQHITDYSKHIRRIHWDDVIIDRVISPYNNTMSSMSYVNHTTSSVHMNKLLCTLNWLFNSRDHILYISTLSSVYTMRIHDIIDFLYILQTTSKSNGGNAKPLYIPPDVFYTSTPQVLYVNTQYFIRSAYTLLTMYMNTYDIIRYGSMVSITFDNHTIYGFDVLLQTDCVNRPLHCTYIDIIQHIHDLYPHEHIDFFYTTHSVIASHIFNVFPNNDVKSGHDILLSIYTDHIIIIIDNPHRTHMKFYKPIIQQKYKTCFVITPSL